MKDKKECRLILDFKKLGIDIFEEFGKYNYLNTQEKLKMHIHQDAIEICYLAKGSQEYLVDKEVYHLIGSDIFLSFPNEYHGSGDIPEEKGCLYWMSIKRPTLGTDFLGLPFKDAQFLFSSILNLPNRLFKGNTEYERTLQEIIKLYTKRNISLLDILEIKNLLIHSLILILRLGNKAKNKCHDKRILKILKYIDLHIFDNIYISDLADMCNLSESRFKHLFKEITGIPPAEYIIREKIKKAKILLTNSNTTIQDIAYDLGFSSPAYFSTVFKQYTGYSPSQYTEENHPLSKR